MPRFLITGGCGFLGSNLAAEAIRRNADVVVFDNLSRIGAERNLKWLRSIGPICHIPADIRDAGAVMKAIAESKPDAIFHLAGQVAMTTSLSNPRLDFEINALGTINVLESIRQIIPTCPIIFSSTNKVYGDLEALSYTEDSTRFSAPAFPYGLDETLPLDFRSPYGCSKGSADQYIRDYARCFGLRTIVFRHSSVFGERQFSTVDQGWVGWFIRQALETKQNPNRSPFTISGNGKQVRDILFSSDIVSCYFSALSEVNRCSGEAFNIGGGIENSLSLLELLSFLQRELNIRLHFNCLPPRQSDQKFFVADIRKASAKFHWKPKVSRDEGLRKMLCWCETND